MTTGFDHITRRDGSEPPADGEQIVRWPGAPRLRARRTPVQRLTTVAVAALVAVLGGVAGPAVLGTEHASAAPAIRGLGEPADANKADFAPIVAAVAPAILRIEVGTAQTGTAGTAIVLTPTGDVVTNAHVVTGATTATLISGKTRYTARVMATDAAEDLAWLRIDNASRLPVVRLSQRSVRVGEDVVAITNGLNLDGAPSVTRGIVSGVGRSTTTLHDVIQTDAAISSGSSGGALVDASGRVIGIVTEAVVGNATTIAENVAFAIPSERVATVLARLGLGTTKV